MPDLSTLRSYSFLIWSGIYLALWWVTSGGAGWLFGVPSALLAAWLAVRMGLEPQRLRWLQLPGFVVFLLRETLLGAWDVARRVLAPNCRIAPVWTRYAFAVSDPRVRYLTSLVVCLMPGSFAARIDGGELEVHVLDEAMNWRPVVVQTELRLARLLGVEEGA